MNNLFFSRSMKSFFRKKPSNNSHHNLTEYQHEHPFYRTLNLVTSNKRLFSNKNKVKSEFFRLKIKSQLPLQQKDNSLELKPKCIIDEHSAVQDMTDITQDNILEIDK